MSPGRKICLVQYNSSRYLARVDRAARTLASDGWDVVLVAIKDAETPEYEQRNGYVVRRVELVSRRWPRWTRPVRFVEAVWRTYRAARRERADVYNARDIYPLFVCWWAAKRSGAVLVYDSDELNLYRNWPWTSKRWWQVLARAYEGFFIRRAAANITSDHGRADILARTYDIERPVVVRNVPERIEHVERDEAWRSEMLGDSRYLLIYQGILAPNRGLPELVDAMLHLSDCSLALVGWGALADELTSQVEDLGLGDRVHLTGPVPYPTMMRYTASADVGLIPIVGSCLSYVYAAPNKLFEDMMVGVPVVASDLPEMAGIVRTERIGSLIPDPLDPASIAHAVRELLDGDEPLAAIGARAREAALARHNWELEREKLLAVYRDVVIPQLEGGRAA